VTNPMTPRDVPEVENVWPAYCSTCDDKGFVRDEDNGGLCLDCDWRRNGYRVQRAFFKMEEQRDSALSTIAEMREAITNAHRLLGKLRGIDMHNANVRDSVVTAFGYLDFTLSRLPVASPASKASTEAKP
jgi:hypothetical protein